MKTLLSSIVCVVFAMVSGFEAQCVAQQVAPARGAEVAVRTVTQSKAQLDATQRRELQEWVARGGALRVSSDAAGLFGFGTVAPRERTAARAGQRWGRATLTLPWGASALSWSAKGQSQAAEADGLPGVRNVFYTLPDPEDVLVSDVGAAGIPLLGVHDVGAPVDGGPEKPLYAAALRSYGRGWVLFAPNHIEARADGRDFVANLTRFLSLAGAGEWKALPASLLGGEPQSADDWKRLQSALLPAPKTDQRAEDETATDATAEEAPNIDEKMPSISKEVALPVHMVEAKALSAVWQQAPDDEAATSSARAILVLLRARLEMLMDSPERRDVAAFGTAAQRQAFFATQEGGAYATFAAYWNGVLAMQGAQLPLPRSQAAQLQPFSYTLPAQEAATWWNLSQNAPVPDGLLKTDVVKGRATLMQAAQIHQDDPPLLLFWGTASGTPHYIFLSPQEAAWPGLNAATPTDAATSAPITSRIARVMVYPAYNQFRWRLWQGTSQWWAEETPTAFGFSPLPTRDVFFPRLAEVHGKAVWGLGGIMGVQGGRIEAIELPYLKNGVSVTVNQLESPIEPIEATLSRPNNQFDPDGESPQAKQERVTVFAAGTGWMSWTSQQSYTTLVPARVARFQAVRSVDFWGEGRPVPDWMEEGIENLWSIDLADHLEENKNQREKWSMNVPALLIPLLNTESDPNKIGSRYWPKYVIQAARTLSLASEDLDQPVQMAGLDPKPKNVGETNGPDLEEQESTIVMRYFYDKYGTGAVIETLQRLGAGETIDEALGHTTGVTEQQLLDAAHDATPGK